MQAVENYEYELPSDFEDEEIDEETAFTEEDKKLYADWGLDGKISKTKTKAATPDLLESEESDGDEEEYNADDFSEPVRLICKSTMTTDDRPMKPN